MLKLDYSLESPEERNKLVQQILTEKEENGETINQKYLDALADYLILCMEKQEKKERKILTDNRMTTVNKREMSFEGLVSQFENGEDGIYSLITDNKNTIFQPKVTITTKDLEDIPLLKQLREAIKFWEDRARTASGREAYIIKHTLIDLRKDQYVIKNAFRRPLAISTTSHGSNAPQLLGEEYIDENGEVRSQGLSLVNPDVVSGILCNYSRLKESGYGNFDGDTWYLMQDFDSISEKALKDYPLYQRLVEYKIDGRQNLDIQEALQFEFGIKHSVEYISSLWRNKIPKMIAEQAEDDFLQYYYLQIEKGKYKRCSRCGEIKLAHNKYFSKNKTSKDGFYSICKKCRNAKTNALGQK